MPHRLFVKEAQLEVNLSFVLQDSDIVKKKDSFTLCKICENTDFRWPV